jgi:hypothetical protein
MGISRGTRLAVAGGLVVVVALVAGCGSASQRPAAPRVVVPGAAGQAIVIGGFGPASGEGGEQAAAASGLPPH